MSEYQQLHRYAREHGFSAAEARAAWRAVGGRLPRKRNPDYGKRGRLLAGAYIIAAVFFLHNVYQPKPQA